MRRTITDSTTVTVFVSLEEVLDLIKRSGLIEDLPDDDRHSTVIAEIGDDEIAIEWERP